MKCLIYLLLLLQLTPPTQSRKARHGSNITVAWDFTDNDASAGLMFFSIKSTFNAGAVAVEFKQVPKTVRQASFVVLFNPQDPKQVFYVISAVYDGQKGESFPSNTIVVERIGPPPTE